MVQLGKFVVCVSQLAWTQLTCFTSQSFTSFVRKDETASRQQKKAKISHTAGASQSATQRKRQVSRQPLRGLYCSLVHNTLAHKRRLVHVKLEERPTHHSYAHTHTRGTLWYQRELLYVYFALRCLCLLNFVFS